MDISPTMVQLHNQGSQFCTLKCDKCYTSAYGKSSLEHRMAQRYFSASVRGHDINLSLHASVHCIDFSSTGSLRTALASLLCRKLSWKICCSDSSLSLKCFQNWPQRVGAGYPGMGRTKGLLGISSLSWSEEGILEDPSRIQCTRLPKSVVLLASGRQYSRVRM